MAKNSSVGKQGEEAAERYLKSIGYDIRGRNVRMGKDEIDILAHDPVDDVVVFAEVKTRSRSSDDYPPELNMRGFKKWKLMRAARTWVSRHEYEKGYRMDLICIVDGRVTEHLKELEWEL
jgi:putative endonuclease